MKALKATSDVPDRVFRTHGSGEDVLVLVAPGAEGTFEVCEGLIAYGSRSRNQFAGFKISFAVIETMTVPMMVLHEFEEMHVCNCFRALPRAELAPRRATP